MTAGYVNCRSRGAHESDDHMTDVSPIDNYVHPSPALKVLKPRGCGQPRPGAYRRPGALVGHTPMLRIAAPFSHDDRGFWAKLEGFNPGGSMKDRPAMHMVEMARACSELRPGARIVESTSGSLGLGLALAGQVYGHPVTVVTDTGMEPTKGFESSRTEEN